MDDLVPCINDVFFLKSARTNPVLPMFGRTHVLELIFVHLMRIVTFLYFLRVRHHLEEDAAIACLNVYTLAILVVDLVCIDEVSVNLYATILSQRKTNY